MAASLHAQVLSSIPPGTRIVLRVTTHYGSVPPDNCYSTTVLYTVPPTLPSGEYNLTVETDYRNHVFEYNRENNNQRWKAITIQEEHPDLTILSSVGLSTSIEGNWLSINYTVLNTGAGPTFGSTWRDVIVITNVQTGSATQLRNHIHYGVLVQDGNYSNHFGMNLQEAMTGNYVLRVQTDIDQRITEENENNNIFIYRLTIPTIYTDLFVYNVTTNLEQDIVAGNQLEITWFVRNLGNGLAREYWQDAVYIDNFPSLSPSGILLSHVTANNLLMPGQEYHQTLNVTIPITLSGDYFIFVHVDSNMDLFENGNIQNNIISFPLLVVSPPSPDLMISSLSYSQTQTESNDRILHVSWTVTNIGNTMEELSSWRDEVFLSKGTTFNESESINIGYANVRNQALASNQDYSASITTVLNSNISGYHYIFVITDISREQLELNGEFNNIERSSDIVDIIPPPLPQLRVTIDSDSYPNSLTSGNTLTVSYNVTNNGEKSIPLSSWIDQIYLSSQSGEDRATILENGVLIGEVINNRDLEVSETYSESTVVSLPYDINQYVYLIVVVDINENLGDPLMIGDMQVLHSVSSHSFLIENGPLPDLRIAPKLASTFFRSGEPSILQFQVTNQGERTASGPWYDTVYLSRNAAVDELDIRLITTPNNKSLDVRGSYNQSVVVFIPYNLPSSEYYLFFETDVGDRQLETNENNNIANIIVNIQTTASTDLVLDEVSTSPNDLQYGQGK